MILGFCVSGVPWVSLVSCISCVSCVSLAFWVSGVYFGLHVYVFLVLLCLRCTFLRSVSYVCSVSSVYVYIEYFVFCFEHFAFVFVVFLMASGVLLYPFVHVGVLLFCSYKTLGFFLHFLISSGAFWGSLCFFLFLFLVFLLLLSVFSELMCFVFVSVVCYFMFGLCVFYAFCVYRFICCFSFLCFAVSCFCETFGFFVGFLVASCVF